MDILVSFIAWIAACAAVGLTISFGVVTLIALLIGTEHRPGRPPPRGRWRA